MFKWGIVQDFMLVRGAIMLLAHAAFSEGARSSFCMNSLLLSLVTPHACHPDVMVVACSTRQTNTAAEGLRDEGRRQLW